MKLTQENIDTEELAEILLEICPMDDNNGLDKIESDFNCKITVFNEKIHTLQYTHFYEIDFGFDEKLFIAISSGIDTGGEITNNDWGYSTKHETKTVQVLKDIILDSSCYEEGSFMKKKAQAVLNANKTKLFEFHRQDNYDNYVTGGNSKMQLNSLLSQLHIEWVYEEVEADCSFV